MVYTIYNMYIIMIIEKAKSISVTKITKSATKNPMLIKLTCMLMITVVDVYTKN